MGFIALGSCFQVLGACVTDFGRPFGHGREGQCKLNRHDVGLQGLGLSSSGSFPKP